MPDSCICATSASSWFFTEPPSTPIRSGPQLRSPAAAGYGDVLLSCSVGSSLFSRFGLQFRIGLQVGDRLRSGAHAGSQLIRRNPGCSTGGDEEISTQTGT